MLKEYIERQLAQNSTELNDLKLKYNRLLAELEEAERKKQSLQEERDIESEIFSPRSVKKQNVGKTEELQKKIQDIQENIERVKGLLGQSEAREREYLDIMDEIVSRETLIQKKERKNDTVTIQKEDKAIPKLETDIDEKKKQIDQVIESAVVRECDYVDVEGKADSVQVNNQESIKIQTDILKKETLTDGEKGMAEKTTKVIEEEKPEKSEKTIAEKKTEKKKIENPEKTIEEEKIKNTEKVIEKDRKTEKVIEKGGAGKTESEIEKKVVEKSENAIKEEKDEKYETDSEEGVTEEDKKYTEEVPLEENLQETRQFQKREKNTVEASDSLNLRETIMAGIENTIMRQVNENSMVDLDENIDVKDSFLDRDEEIKSEEVIILEREREKEVEFLSKIYKKVEISLALLNGDRNRCKNELRDIKRLIQNYVKSLG